MKHANISVFVPHNGCPHTCAFCNQRTISGGSSQPTAEDVKRTLSDDYSRCCGDTSVFRELAFFGGSFTAVDRDYMIALLESAQPYLDNGFLCGIRCSTRPDCIDSEVLDILKAYRVTAIELGAQSMDDRVLALNQRGHTAADVENASGMITQYGFELGLQMMTGLYGDSDDGARMTARRIADLHPATVRIYPTVVLRGTELARLYESGEFSPQGVEGAVNICSELLRFFNQRDIRVIRLGLHASRDVEAQYVAGAYHPAMRELCESRLFLRDMLEILNKNFPDAHSDSFSEEICFRVSPKDISKALGQKRSNISALQNLGFKVRICADADIPQGTVRMAQL